MNDVHAFPIQKNLFFYAYLLTLKNIETFKNMANVKVWWKPAHLVSKAGKSYFGIFFIILIFQKGVHIYLL